MTSIKFVFLCLTVGFVISCSNQSPSTIKSIATAYYNIDSSEKLSREDALKQKLHHKEFFNEKGRSVEKRNYLPDGTLYFKSIDVFRKGKHMESYYYDERDSLISHSIAIDSTLLKEYDSQENLIRTTRAQFDGRGNIITVITTDINTNKTSRFFHEYNALNQLIKLTTIADSQTVKLETFAYNKQGQQSEHVRKLPDGHYIKSLFHYDNFGTVVKEVNYNEQGKEIQHNEFVLVYDNRNNWLTQKKYTGGELTTIWEREIEYY